ncbi:DUF4031 domain-containing protein [Ornithinimicrobium faecis]|uniref:DUF4031 domain-containing protein n=1 Tax=Ornithinimicrobium faecis TaxID=2934158 RepID=A0ABY4YVI3_9MICO|nr:DUF4031 domain-containing protein [Ornithinimicrobium sp. HY1793]USQ80786.1 DUF4031 domain-containing protein [Ornithinimicrobium sp. HY1793]
MTDQQPLPLDESSLTTLKASWHADLQVLAPEAPEQLRSAEVDLLLVRWSEPHRRYHDVQHLAEVLAAIDELAQAGEVDPVGARLARVAAWFHDAVYDARAEAGSNEHRSATMARDHLNTLGVTQGNVDVVEALVLMTLDHDADGGASLLASRRHTVAALHDADLWILNAPAERYAEYARQVRAEYAHVPDDLFAQGRSAILSDFAQREQLYRTAHACTQWQDAARTNLAAELAALRG